MSIKEFDKNFLPNPNLIEEKNKFVIRIENSFFNALIKGSSHEQYEALLKKVCYEIGEDYKKYITRLMGVTTISGFQEITKGDFIQTLRILVAINFCYRDNEGMQAIISEQINKALDKSSIDIGVKWSDGIFYPTGDETLDKELIETSINLLNRYPNEKRDLLSALDNHYAKRLDSVIDKCYLVIEGLARQILGNNKNLDNNKEELLRYLSFTDHWKSILVSYMKYANEYSRHASDNRHNLNPEEVEAFLYLTCLFVRSIIKADDRKKAASTPTLS